MTPASNPNHWQALIPAMPSGTTVMYYIEAVANSGKQQVRPMPAPAGFWDFKVLGNPSGTGLNEMEVVVSELFPNPSKGITCLVIQEPWSSRKIDVLLKDIQGRDIIQVFRGLTHNGVNRYFFNS